MKKVRLAVIPVAGYGTRFLPFTKAVPKPMLPILNRPAIEIIAKEAADSGIEEIVFVVGHKKEILQDHFSPCEELERVLQKGNKQEFLNAIPLEKREYSLSCSIASTIFLRKVRKSLAPSLKSILQTLLISL